MINDKWFTIKKQEIKTVDNFWQAISILLTKPFALNRNIGGCDLFNVGLYSNERVYEIRNYVESNLLNSDLKEYNQIKKLLNEYLSINNLSVKCSYFDLLNNIKQQQDTLFLRLTFPKNGVFRRDIFDLIHCDFKNTSVTFMKLCKTSDRPHLLPDLPFKLECSENKLRLLVQNIKDDEESTKFLKSTQFPKLLSWIEADLMKDQIHSLCLVEVDEYVILYNKLKKKYVNLIKKIWTECTNVEKFIHEDIAIATYLILLWENKPQKFVDLGCGNGLLVYILNSEGNNGIGIDVRPRKIWSMYPVTTILKVMSITPSESSLFPEADWIIGNHSDELTPWIPVITLRSSYRANFFLLPCCAYEFDGRKYSRNNILKSQYFDYMDYIEGIGRKCGFMILQDRLRIPSTKRICFVTKGRTYSESEQKDVDEEVTKLIYSQSQLRPDISGRWLMGYKPREAKERVHNCTQLDKQLINNIVLKVSNIILKDICTNVWNEGKPTNLCDIVKSIPVDMLLQLKNECGGIQTVIRNHHHIFLIENGKVKFRKPIERKKIEDRWKRKHCWFYNYHPDSCPLTSEKCSYIHEKQ